MAGRPPGDSPPPPPRHAAPTGHAGQGDSVRPPHPHTRARSTWVADPHSPPSGRAAGGGTAPDAGRPSQRWKTPPPGDALPPPPQRATPARKGARCGAGAGSTGPHRPHPGHTGRGTLAARSRGRAAGGGTAPDTRRPSQQWQATPPRRRPSATPAARSPHRACRPRGQCWAPHTHTPAPTARGWRMPTARPYGRAVGGGTARGLRRPPQWWKAPPPGTPFRHPHSEQRWPARAHAVGPVLGPHARTDRTRDTRVAEPWLPARDDGRPGEGQRLTPGAPHNGGRPSLPGTAPHPPRGTQLPQGMQAKGTVLGPHTHTPAPTARGWRTPTARLYGQAVGGRTARGLRPPSQWWKAPLPGTPFRHPHSEQHRPARAHAVGPVLGPHAPTEGDTQVAEPWLPAPEDGRPGEGQRLTPGAPHNSGRPPPPGTPFRHPRGAQPPQGVQARGTVLGPHTHTPAPTARGWRTPTARPIGGQSGEGQRLTSDAPHTMVEGTPPRDALPPPPQRATLACKGARCGAGAGSPRPQ